LDTGSPRVSSGPLGSDLAKVDAHEITAQEYAEIPELTDEDFERGCWMIGGRPASEADARRAFAMGLRPGRPRAARPKVAVSIRLSADVLERFKARGPGWQTRIDAALADWLEKNKS
jgi:uncharacterized protein (DUF4415 family)